MPLVLLAAASIIVAGAVASPPARADGTYTVGVCDPAYGNVNHAFQFGESWQTMASAQNCTGGAVGSGQGLQTWSTGATPGGSGAGWWFHAPAGTTITGLSSTAQFSAWGGWVAHWATSEDGGGDPELDTGADCDLTNCNVIGGKLSSGVQYSVGVDHAGLIGFGIWCDASSCPANSPWSIFGPAASANVYQADVTVDEPNPPTFTDFNSTLVNHPGWISAYAPPSGGWYVTYNAGGDGAGICALQAVITNTAGGWELADQHNVSPDYSQAAPCPTRGGYTWSPNIAALPNGYHYLWVQASNPANMWSNANGGPIVLAVDNTPPTIGVLSAPAPGRWYDSPQSVIWSASDSVSGVAGLSCSDGWHPGTSGYTMTVSQQGSTSVGCSALDNAGNWSGTASTTVNLDFQSPAVSFNGPSQNAWLRGTQTVTVSAAEQQPLSGIAGVSCALDGGSSVWTAGSQATVTATANGVHTIECQALTNAGTWGPIAGYTLHIDSTPPTLSFSDGPDQGRWYGSAQSIQATAQGVPGLAPVALISCTINRQTTTYPGAQAQVTVQSPGGSLLCQAEDQAGNWSAIAPWQFLIATTPPSGFFAPRDPGDPDLVAVEVADALDGVAGGEIEIQTAAGWQPLPTTYDQTSGELTASIPDDGSIPDGTYPLRAIVWDAVGNQAMITTDQTGTTETVTLPLRIVTQMHVGRASILTNRCTLTRVPLPSGNRKPRGQHPTAKIVKHCTTVAVPAPGTPRLSYGQAASVQGLIQTADGEPIAGAPVDVHAQAPGWTGQSAGTITTDLQGRFTYQIAPGPSRTITFSFPGTGTLRGTGATLNVLVAGKATITASSTARAGRPLRLSGRLLGGYIPTDGTLIQLQYRVNGYPEGWEPFDVLVHTRPNGDWSTTVKLPTDAAGFTYLIRAVVSAQTGWPFTGAVTNIVARHVTR